MEIFNSKSLIEEKTVIVNLIPGSFQVTFILHGLVHTIRYDLIAFISLKIIPGFFTNFHQSLH